MKAHVPASVEAALLETLAEVERDGITEAELVKAKAQLRARLVFDSDSVTNIAHQLGYYETIAERGSVHQRAGPDRRGDARRGGRRCARRLAVANRTIGTFEPRSSSFDVRRSMFVVLRSPSADT